MIETISPRDNLTPKELQGTKTAQQNKLAASSVCALALVALAVLAGYSSVLFSWFAGDDFVHLAWLSQAVHQPELIWRNFHSSWLDLTTTQFYRPLISVFMVTDYLLWGTNGFGFHLTNVLFLFTGAAALFFITRTLLRDATHIKRRDGCAFAASLLFGIYPLHCEAVSWITGRVDAIVTAFSLLSLWGYMQWRRTKGATAFLSCWLCLVLALFSKEMALTLPCVFFAYDVLIASERSRAGLFNKALVAAKNTAPFWLTLVLYFALRRLALGTFVGGYDNSLFFISDVKHFVLSWLHGLHMLIVPANRELMSSHNVFVIDWQAGAAACAILTMLNCTGDTFLRRRTLFLLSWLAFSLAPVYKIFAIADDLQGSRLAFLATAPVACLLAFATLRLAGQETEAKARFTASNFIPIAAMAMLAVSGFYMLEKNNSAWAQAGTVSNAIRTSLQQFYVATTGDPQVLIAALPDTIHGAYVVRNALPGMTKAPQLSRDINNALLVNLLEPVLPLGYLKPSIVEGASDITFLSWNPADRQLHKIDTRTFIDSRRHRFNGKDLARSLAAEAETCRLSSTADGTVEVTSTGTRRHPLVAIKAPAFNCFNTDFIRVDATVIDPGDRSGVDVFYKNKIATSFDLRHRVHCDVSAKGPATWLFALHALPEWTLGETGQLELQMPPGSDIKIRSVETVDPATLMPSLSFGNSGYLGTKGFAHLSEKDRTLQLDYDAVHVPGAASVALEITRPNLYFEEGEQNTASQSKVVMTRIVCPSVKGTAQIDRKAFPQAGLYELRPYAIDQQGAPLGVSGDHIVIAVDS